MIIYLIKKLKKLENKILNLEKIYKKIENKIQNNGEKVAPQKPQNETEVGENWNKVVDEWLNGDRKNKN